MRVGLISDTHDNAPAVRHAARFFLEQGVDLVLHLGDVCEPETFALLEGLPVQAVRGNNDVALARLPDSWQSNLAGIDVFATHGHIPGMIRGAVGRVDLILHGHTHKRRLTRFDRSLVVNPGALWRCKERTIAILTLPSLEVAFFPVGEDGVRPALAE
ncbi:MAG: uncharacterized protein QOE90_3221 [Thermoplasmata archaeon]|jgi:putative phosphoesterase|nr:uncharacterized protein [Thermoplasmata archaeon]